MNDWMTRNNWWGKWTKKNSKNLKDWLKSKFESNDNEQNDDILRSQMKLLMRWERLRLDMSLLIIKLWWWGVDQCDQQERKG